MSTAAVRATSLILMKPQGMMQLFNEVSIRRVRQCFLYFNLKNISTLHDFTSATLFLFTLWLTDGELYAGVYIDFMGTDSAIFRTLGKQTAMRTDQYNSRWLNGNVSTRCLFCSQHYLFHSSLCRFNLFLSSWSTLYCNVSPNFPICCFNTAPHIVHS